MTWYHGWPRLLVLFHQLLRRRQRLLLRVRPHHRLLPPHRKHCLVDNFFHLQPDAQVNTIACFSEKSLPRFGNLSHLPQPDVQLDITSEDAKADADATADAEAQAHASREVPKPRWKQGIGETLVCQRRYSYIKALKEAQAIVDAQVQSAFMFPCRGWSFTKCVDKEEVRVKLRFNLFIQSLGIESAVTHVFGP